MYSATPPENTMRPNGPRDRSTGVIHNPISPSCNVPPMISRISLPIALAKPSRRLPATRAPSPGTSTPADWASRRPASSNRTTLASLSQASSLAPKCTAAVSRTSPHWQTGGRRVALREVREWSGAGRRVFENLVSCHVLPLRLLLPAPLQHQLREEEVRRRRANVDVDAVELDAFADVGKGALVEVIDVF